MIKLLHRSKMRRVLSAVCAAAMITSIIVMPAYARQTGTVDASASSLGSGFTAVEGEYDRGVHGTLTLTTTGTPAQQASQESVNTYSESAQATTTLGGAGANSLGVQYFTLYVSIWSNSYSGPGGPSFVSTTVAVPGLTAGTTMAELATAIDSAIGGLPYQLAGDAFFTSTGKLRVVKRFAEGTDPSPVNGVSSDNNAEIWVHSGSDPNDTSTDPAGQLSVAEAAFGDSINPWGRYSPMGDTYKYGIGNLDYSIEATWTPLWGLDIGGLGAGFDFGSFDGGVMDDDNFQSMADTSTGLFTAVRSSSWPGGYVLLSTAGRTSPVGDGTSLVVFNNGVRDPAYEDDTAPDVTPSGVATAGATTTWTVDYDDPDSTLETWDSSENAYNGFSILIPKEFTLVNGPLHNDFIAQTVASFGTTPTVTQQNTSEGWLITVSNFVDHPDADDGITFSFSLAATTTAGPTDIGAKIWIHNVGTPWTADPTVTQLIDPNYPDTQDDGIRDTDWFPVFCDFGEVDMEIQPDVVQSITAMADPNRAMGYTALTVNAVDQYGNDVSGWVGYDVPTITGLADGASVTAVDPDEWIWRLADTPGTNTATLVGDDSRTAADENVSDSVSFSNVGFGEPHKLVVIPDEAGYITGDIMAAQVQLQDANGNPTSWLDDHWAGDSPLIETDLIEIVANSENLPFGNGQRAVSAYVHKGWAKSNGISSSGGPAVDGWPTFVSVPGPPVEGPDVWTFSAKHHSGSVLPAEFVSRIVMAEDPDLVGVADHIKVVAVEQAPAEFATGDFIYNDKTDDYDDDAFGWAAATSDVATASIMLSAWIVDKYDNPITVDVANKPVTWGVPKMNTYTNAILPTGHTYDTTTNAQGVATVEVKSFSPTISTRIVDDFGWNTLSWFTPIAVDMGTYRALGTGWAYPCPSDAKLDLGFGFTYFHGAKLTAELEQTPEREDKDVALADGADTVGYTATVMDSALFDTPIPNWNVKFTTSLGTFADGSKAVTTTTDANGQASVTVKSPTAGTAYLRVYDRLHTIDGFPFFQNSVIDSVEFTDYKFMYEVLDATMRAGDRATARVRAWIENIKTGSRVTWTPTLPNDGGNIDEDMDQDVFGYDTANTHGDGVDAPQWTNDFDVTNWDVDSNGDGMADAIDLTIPAYDDSDIQFESAFRRYALLQGDFSVTGWVNQVFYNQLDLVAAPARPEVNFVKEATLKAEGTQLDSAISLWGDGYTPGLNLPSGTDQVDIYLGDITTGTTQWLGYGYVGRDGMLLPSAVTSGLNRMSPGLYDITVDGLVFKNGLEIKNLFKEAWVSIDGKKPGAEPIYVDGSKEIVVQVNAFGALSHEVWAGSLKLANTNAEGRTFMPADSMDPGLHWMTAKIKWPISGVFNVATNQITDGPSFLDNGYVTTVVRNQYYVVAPLKFSSTSLSKSGRTLKLKGNVSGKPEANGSTAYSIKVTIQKLVGGKWKTYKTKTVTASAGKYSLNYKVGSAGKYRAVVSHSDKAHPKSSKTSGSVTVK